MARCTVDIGAVDGPIALGLWSLLGPVNFRVGYMFINFPSSIINIDVGQDFCRGFLHPRILFCECVGRNPGSMARAGLYRFATYGEARDE
jgi:hypothetical protein